MRTFDIRYENGWFFHKSLLTVLKNCQSEQKKSVLDGPSDQIQKFSKLHFCYDSKNVAEITQIQVSNFLSLAEICRENAFPCNFHKIFKGPSFHCQKFLDLKSLWKCKKLWVLLIFVMKMVGFFFGRSLEKVVRKLPKWKKNGKQKTSVFLGR